MIDSAHDLMMESPRTWDLLTERQRDIARLMAEGLQTKEIAARLHIEVRTVQAHKYDFFRKIGADNAIQALAKLYWFVPKQ